MVHRKVAVLLASLPLVVLAPTVFGAINFQRLPDAAGSSFPGGMAAGVSGNGSTVVGWDILPTSQGGGSYGKLPARWTTGVGPTEVSGSTVGGQAYAASFSGSVIVGAMNQSNGLSDYRAFRWTQASGMVSLGVPAGTTQSFAYATSSDGSIVAGDAYNSQTGSVHQATRWSATDGIATLGGGSLSANGSTSYGVSGDGSVIVGIAHPNNEISAPFRWTASTGMQSMAALTPSSGVGWGSAAAISADGLTVVGNAGSSVAGNPFNGSNTAYRWSLTTGFVDLGFGTPTAVSADGSIVAGNGNRGIANPSSSAAFWTASGQQINVADLLTTSGIDLTGWSSLESVSGVSSDGTVLVGSGFYLGHQEAWTATVPEPTGLAVIGVVSSLTACSRRHRSLCRS